MKNKLTKSLFYATIYAFLLLFATANTFAEKNLDAPVLNLDTEYVYVNQFRVSWDAVEGATHYKIWVNVWDADQGDYLPLYNGKIITSNFAWVFNLSPNTSYECHIRAYNDTEESPSSNYIQATTFPANIAAPVLEAATDITSDSFTISWSSIEGTQPVYNVLVSKDDFQTLVPGLPVFTESTSLVISGLEPYTNYKFKVNGQDFQGENMSSFSETLNVTTVLPPPIALEATDVMHDRFTANWTSVVNTTGYNLWVVYNQQPLEGYWPLAVSDTTYTVTGLESEETYTYLVTSVAGAHSSDFSDAIEVTTTPLIPDVPVALEGSDITLTAFTANWEAADNADGYLLYVSQDNFTTHLDGYDGKDISGLSENITELEPETTYKYRLKAYKEDVESDYSNTIEVTTTDPGTSVAIMAEANISIYPNPAQNHIYIEGLETNSTIDIYSITGAKMMQLVNLSGSVSLDVSSFGNGIYIIKIKASNGVVSRKILINE